MAVIGLIKVVAHAVETDEAEIPEWRPVAEAGKASVFTELLQYQRKQHICCNQNKQKSRHGGEANRDGTQEASISTLCREIAVARTAEPYTR